MSDKAKGRRVTIDLTASAVDELDRIRDVTGLTTADLFRNGFSLLRLYIQAKEKGQSFVVSDDNDPTSVITRIELPFIVPEKERAGAKGEVGA
ncbi:hypothetical protein FHS27_001318 [Rhodopirellula rubra]|uniref:Ribbon-helix-helix protein CopG domain-containing protein n=1 Tax=Aporhodopirellula rubra TaxID=980271 RepID=A0A7W5DW07_9BACT|nr:hypothetical protein [Aporhodopirellula rubra]MBB3205518.1 hypothetical protein [Aporhodopirellula rubra]